MSIWSIRASQVAQVVKNPLVNAEVARDVGWIPGLGISSRGGNGNPLQYSCMENHMNRGTWWAMVYGLAKELDTTKVTEHAYMHCKYREAGFFCNTFTWMDLKD